MNKTEQFFYDNAGYSYDPKTETAEQGRKRCAQQLAAAEVFARDAGISYSWEIDPDTASADWNDDPEPWPTFQCAMYNSEGEIIGNLGGVDFGRDGTPCSSTYRRVVEAELALEITE